MFGQGSPKMGFEGFEEPGLRFSAFVGCVLVTLLEAPCRWAGGILPFSEQRLGAPKSQITADPDKAP